MMDIKVPAQLMWVHWRESNSAAWKQLRDEVILNRRKRQEMNLAILWHSRIMEIHWLYFHRNKYQDFVLSIGMYLLNSCLPPSNRSLGQNLLSLFDISLHTFNLDQNPLPLTAKQELSPHSLPIFLFLKGQVGLGDQSPPAVVFGYKMCPLSLQIYRIVYHNRTSTE